MKLVPSLLFFMATIPLSAESQDEPAIVAGKNIAIVQTVYGAVRGYIHHGIFTFKGIPYGEAERFLPAQKPASWKGIRSSMTYGPVCPGNLGPVLSDEYEFPFHRDRGYYSNENCLNLNIWTKKTGAGEKKPVMVWLHGGGFSSGSSVEFPSYDGENLSRKGDVVVVSINHRLNTLGFLDLSAYGEKYKYSGNAGAMDMVLALTWVKENIAQFGGDPGNVTIFGQSGGGAKVVCLMNTPSAKGLFHKAIVQSGSYLTHFTEDSIAKKVSAALLDLLKIEPSQIDSLQKMPYDILAAAGQKALAKVQKTLKPGDVTVFGLDWEPIRDGDYLPYQPGEAAAIELSKDIPLLVGSCKNEYNPFNPATRELSIEGVRAQLQKKYGEKTAAYMAAVKKAYPETVKPSDYIDIDLIFRPLVIGEADQKALSGTAPVFVYLFAWQSPVMDGIFKAYHNMDLPFVFNNIGRCEEMTGGGKEAYVMADKVSTAWANFAHRGNPNHKGLPVWPSYTPENGAVMIFDRECQVKNHHDQELLALRAH
ncbi:MAG TPA: carboxylesterase family protein [Puia sp.]|nr:carboxylesterase family protein [Puia sp.]